MTEEELKQHIYELSYALDNYSAGKDYVALRRTHYNNIEWLQKHGLTDEYYDVFFEHIKEEKEMPRKIDNKDISDSLVAFCEKTISEYEEQNE